jgi:hypothetical protein
VSRKGEKQCRNGTYGNGFPGYISKIGFMDDKPKNAALQKGVDVGYRRGMREDIENIVVMTRNQRGVFCHDLSYIIKQIGPAG